MSSHAQDDALAGTISEVRPRRLLGTARTPERQAADETGAQLFADLVAATGADRARVADHVGVNERRLRTCGDRDSGITAPLSYAVLVCQRWPGAAEAASAFFGGLAQRSGTGAQPLLHLANLVDELGDVGREVKAAIAGDGKIDDEERARIRHELLDLIARARTMLGDLQP